MTKQTTTATSAVNSLAIRPVAAADESELAAFFSDNNCPEITDYFTPFALNAETAEKITTTTHLDRYYLGMLGETIIGFMMLRGWDEGYEIPSFGVFVDHRHQGKSFGRKLTDFAISEAMRLRCPAIRLSVYASNDRAVRLYASLGFRENGRVTVVRNGKADEKIEMLMTLK